jgi:hypothetical protein
LPQAKRARRSSASFASYAQTYAGTGKLYALRLGRTRRCNETTPFIA